MLTNAMMASNVTNLLRGLVTVAQPRAAMKGKRITDGAQLGILVSEMNT